MDATAYRVIYLKSIIKKDKYNNKSKVLKPLRYSLTCLLIILPTSRLFREKLGIIKSTEREKIAQETCNLVILPGSWKKYLALSLFFLIKVPSCFSNEQYKEAKKKKKIRWNP